jgi:putative transposase
MHFEAEQLYHVYNRGNNRAPLFFTPDHYLYFLRKIRQHIAPHCELLAYCLMPNHFHLLLCTTAAGCLDRATASTTRQPLVQGIASALSSYTQGVNQQLLRTGSLFQSKTRIKRLLDQRGDYPRTCFHYIHQNPLRAGLEMQPGDWAYSSYRDYAGLRKDTLCNQALARELLALPDNPLDFRAEAARTIPAAYMAGGL